MAKNMRTSWFVAMAMLAPAFCGQVAWGNPGLIDDFNDTNLSEYTASYILEQDASNTITFASPSPSGVLQATKVDPGGTNAEQVVFLRNDYSLAVGETLRVDSMAADTALYADFGIVVSTTVDPADAVWTTGTADVRRGVLAIYGKPLFDSVGWLGRANDATPGTNVGSSAGVGITWSDYRGLWIKRNTSTNFTGGWFSATSGFTQLVDWNVTDTAFGSAVGIWADLRAAQTYGDLDNLRIDAAPLLGDVTGDGLVNLADFNVIKMNFFNTGQARNQGDLTGDALVDFADFRQWKAAAGSGFASVTLFGIPEPGTMLLSSVGSLFCVSLIRFRRRSRG